MRNQYERSWSFYQHIIEQYGKNTQENRKYMSKQIPNTSSYKNRRNFLTICKTKNVTSKFLQMNTKHIKFNSNKVYTESRAFKKSYETKP